MDEQDVARQLQSLNKQILEFRRALQASLSDLDKLQRDFADCAAAARLEETKQREGWRTLVLGLLHLVDDCEDFLSCDSNSPLKAGGMSAGDSSVLYHSQSMSQIRNMYEGLKNLLRGEGIVPMEVCAGEAFDPQRHEIVEAVASEAPHGTVLKVLRKGFMRTASVHPDDTGTIVVRKASVIVSRAQETGTG